MDKRKMKKLLILNLPYFLVGLFATNLGEAWSSGRGPSAGSWLSSSHYGLLSAHVCGWQAFP